MSTLVLLLIILLLFGGGGGYYGYRSYGYRGGLGIFGVVLFILILVYLFGGIHF
jgi:hypothetical protein